MDEQPLFLVQHQSHKRSVLLFLSIIAIALIAFASLYNPVDQAIDSAFVTPTPFAPKQTIIVDVQGAVRNPGVQKYQLRFDDHLRIADLIEKAGGLTGEADQDYLASQVNQAQSVLDGYKLYIPIKGEARIESKRLESGKTNINQATQVELEKLPGIGSVRAETIIANRPYVSIDDLKTKTKFSTKVIDGLINQISF